jgi:type I restriction enzyme, S subunit
MNKSNNITELLKGVKVEFLPLWKVTTWDKKFNSVDNHKQKHIIKYNYLLANELKVLISNNGNVKLLTTNTSDLWTTEKLAGKRVSEGEIVAIPWGGNANVQYYKGKFLTADNRIATSNNPDLLSNKYLYYFLLAKKELLNSFYRGSGIKHPNMAQVLDLLIPIPPISIQTEIVRILDTFTALTAELTAELTARKKQYNYYRDKLLTFKEGEVEWKLIGEIASLKRGIRITRNQLSQNNGYHVYQNSLTPLGYYEKANTKENTTFIISAGAAGEIGYSSENFWAADDCFYFECSKDLLSRYLFYVLKNKQEYISSQVRRSSIPRLPRTIIEKLKIPIPPLKEQARIVEILDKFDALTNSITEGLPREIALRQKQYEYYRNLLLDFPKE